jgi:protein TonB
MLIFISLIFLAQNVAASVPQDGQKNHATPSGPANSADYPKEALKKGWEGVAAFTIKVDVDGKPYDCKITESSGHDVLDKETCRYIIMRARFKPAIDSNGKPYVSDFSSKLRWKIPH